MNYQVQLKQGLGAFLGMALLSGTPSALIAAEDAPKADSAVPQNFVIEMEVGGQSPVLAVLRSYDGSVQAQITDPKATLRLTFRDVGEAGAVADYSFGIQNKIEIMQNGVVVNYSYEEQLITGSIYLAKGEKTEVFRSVPISLSFTLKEIGKTAADLKAASVKKGSQELSVELRNAANAKVRSVVAPVNAPKTPSRVRRVPTPPPVKKSSN